MLNQTPKLARDLPKLTEMVTFEFTFHIPYTQMPSIHTKIAALRKKAGLTQCQMAELANIPCRTYQRIETGYSSTNLDYLERIATVLHLTVEKIMDFDPEMGRFVDKHPQLLDEIRSLREENQHLKSFISQFFIPPETPPCNQ